MGRNISNPLGSRQTAHRAAASVKIRECIEYTYAMKGDITLNKPLHTVGAALRYCTEMLEQSDVYFGHGTDNAWDEAVQLVMSAADLTVGTDADVMQLPLSEAAAVHVQELLQRRIREQLPLPYLTGRAWFAELEFHCDQRAIIPRSPIAELILNEFQPWYSGPGPSHVLDLCCGGGCIGLATAYYFPEVLVDLMDIDEDALSLAQENTIQLGLADRVTIRPSDLFDALGENKYDLIISNPPYVDADDLASMPAEYHHEPERALGSGADGLDLTRRILRNAGAFLRETGLLIVEVGNSWPALEQAYPRVPFTWIEFEHGGEGVFILTAAELQEYAPYWRE
jgi:ribosomal protein L3 glutamine methyltransferase